MLAARIGNVGALSAVSLVEVDQPAPGDGEIVVRVAAMALNPLDYKIALYGWRRETAAPYQLGFDAVGTVDSIGTGVTSVAVGDRVCLMADIPTGGTAAEYVLVREHNVALVPESIPNGAAAGLPLAALTAQQAFDIAGLESGQGVLIHAGAGGVGHLAIQLAKLRGATVYATSSAGNLDLLADLGADHPMDYHATSQGKFAGLVDVVLDTQGGVVAQASLQAMKPGSTLVSIVGFLPSPDEERADVKVERMLVEARSDELARLVEFLRDGSLRVLIHKICPLSGIVEALTSLHEGHTVGKRILTVP